MTSGLSRGGLRMYDDANLLTREEALRLWTTGSAWFTGDAGVKGAITPGQLADFAVLDRDYFTVTDAEIAKLKSDLTVLGGEVVYGDGAFCAGRPEAHPGRQPRLVARDPAAGLSRSSLIT